MQEEILLKIIDNSHFNNA